MIQNLLKKIQTSIRAKMMLSIVVILLVFMVLVLFLSSPVLFRVFVSNTYSSLRAYAGEIASLAPDTDSYYFSIYSLATNKSVTVEIVDSDGYRVYSTAGASAAFDGAAFSSFGSTRSIYSHMKESKTHTGKYNYENFEIKNRSGTGADYFIYKLDTDRGETIYIFSSVADVDNIVSVSSAVFSGFTLLLLLIMALVLGGFTRQFTKPVVEMNAVTKEMAALNFSGTCKNYGEDEIGELGNSINILSRSLSDTLEDLKDKNLQLENDIEVRKSLDNARKSFISNVSHELKTPIAIISGYAEGLCEGIVTDPETVKEYCGIINDETRKMNALVVELLELSRLESRAALFNPVEFDLGEKLYNLLEHLSLSFKQNGITVECTVPKSLMTFGQPDKIEIVMKNFLTNAISHTGGERLIRVTPEDKGDRYRINVFNTGENISDTDLPEIWNSFYRADKAHVRKENRFGLGLSIVKSIMETHSCDYGVNNKENGVEFYFEILKNDYYEKIS